MYNKYSSKAHIHTEFMYLVHNVHAYEVKRSLDYISLLSEIH